jgi:hypothetical protein
VSQPEANRAARRLGARLLVGAVIRVGAAAAAQGERAEYRIDNLSPFCKRGSATECTREDVAEQSNDCHARPLRSTLAERSHVADAMGSRNRRQTERRAAAKEPKVSVSSATPAAPSLIAVAPLWGRWRPASNFCFGSIVGVGAGVRCVSLSARHRTFERRSQMTATGLSRTTGALPQYDLLTVVRTHPTLFALAHACPATLLHRASGLWGP